MNHSTCPVHTIYLFNSCPTYTLFMSVSWPNIAWIDLFPRNHNHPGKQCGSWTVGFFTGSTLILASSEASWFVSTLLQKTSDLALHHFSATSEASWSGSTPFLSFLRSQLIWIYAISQPLQKPADLALQCFFSLFRSQLILIYTVFQLIQEAGDLNPHCN